MVAGIIKLTFVVIYIYAKSFGGKHKQNPKLCYQAEAVSKSYTYYVLRSKCLYIDCVTSLLYECWHMSPFKCSVHNSTWRSLFQSISITHKGYTVFILL